MTVQQLIDQLNNVTDKNAEVALFWDENSSIRAIDSVSSDDMPVILVATKGV